jgi:type II secretory pathway pseudopilin PulG
VLVPPRRQRGVSLIEMIVIIAILATLTTISTAAMTSLLRRKDLRASAAHVRSILETTDAEGQTQGAYRGVRFIQAGEQWTYAVYQDGNDNGVTTTDITAGIDRLVQRSRPLLPTGSLAIVGFPPTGVPDPDTGAPLQPGSRPIRFGRANLCSFSENGTCTPGTVYLTDGVASAAAIRCSGATGRIHILYYGLDGQGWSD